MSYLYDNRGNVTKRNAQAFEFDLGNRLKSAPGRATYGYDARYRRVSVVGTDGVTRVQVYSADGKLLYVAPTGLTATKYIHLGNRVLAEVNGSTVTYDHTDALGSPVAQSNASGTITTRTRYEPYGYLVAGSPRTIGFTGHVNDNDTGLVYMQHRYYDTFAGRFLSIDPVTTDANTGGSFNRYNYASNSPYKYIDPDGRNPKLIADLALNVALNVVTAGEIGLASAVKETVVGALSPLKTIKTAGKLAEALKTGNKTGGRNANKVGPVQGAEGPHSVVKRDASGNVTNTATYAPNPQNPTGFDEVKRVDVTVSHIQIQMVRMSQRHMCTRPELKACAPQTLMNSRNNEQLGKYK